MRQENISVNALWIGKELSPTEILTIKSFLYHGHKFILWAYDKIETSIPEGTIIKDANEIFPRKHVFCYKYSNQFGHGKGSYAGFSDIFRYKLLYLHGGWWTDMDVTCLKPLDFDDEYVFRTHHSLPMVGNIMKCPPNSKLMQKCFEEAVKKVDENNRDWHLPIQILVDNVYSLGLERHIREFSNPDSWNLIRKFLKNSPELPPNWYIIHWVNEEWRRNKIKKNAFKKKSLMFSLMKKHQIEIEKTSPLKSIFLSFRLSKINFALNLIKNKLK